MRPILAAFALFCALACPAGAETITGSAPVALPAAAQIITGHARLKDGDSLIINGVEIRLHGADAFEMDQVCHRGAPLAPYRCGLVAAAALRKMIDGREMTCEPVVQADGGTTDRYGRVIASCGVGGIDIGGWLVERGLARAFVRYSPVYLPQEDRARAAGVGAWAGPHMAPWEWRQAKRFGF